jgi:hypothetical protein
VSAAEEPAHLRPPTEPVPMPDGPDEPEHNPPVASTKR